MEPITLSMIGSTEDDPCFGKLFSGDNNICQRCGDAEICLIAMGQSNNARRAQIEQTNSFKDLSPEEFMVDPAQVYRFMLMQLETKKFLAPKKLLKNLNTLFYKGEGDTKDIKKMVMRVIKQTPDLKMVKQENKRRIIKIE